MDLFCFTFTLQEKKRSKHLLWFLTVCRSSAATNIQFIVLLRGNMLWNVALINSGKPGQWHILFGEKGINVYDLVGQQWESNKPHHQWCGVGHLYSTIHLIWQGSLFSGTKRLQSRTPFEKPHHHPVWKPGKMASRAFISFPFFFSLEMKALVV